MRIYYCELDGIPSVDSELLKNSKCLSVYCTCVYSVLTGTSLLYVESSTQEVILILMSKT